MDRTFKSSYNQPKRRTKLWEEDGSVDVLTHAVEAALLGEADVGGVALVRGNFGPFTVEVDVDIFGNVALTVDSPSGLQCVCQNAQNVTTYPANNEP